MVWMDDDNGGRRSAVNRRRFLYGICIPEYRTGNDRRSETDRRKKGYVKFEDIKERRVIFRDYVTPIIASGSVYPLRSIKKFKKI